ncbi:MAG: GNAT family N-acetyltransferase [Bacteroidota bacterium]
MSSSLEIRPIVMDAASRNAISHCLATTFGQAERFTEAFVQWQYEDNPEGPVLGCHAWDGDQIVAHYALQPFTALYQGQSIRCLLSLNTATLPAYQGRGLFTQLANHSYELAASEGFQLVLGVANANSMPGFVRKLGFETLGPLEVRMGVGRLRWTDSKDVNFEPQWSEERLRWRLSSPAGNYQQGRQAIYSATAYPFVQACLGRFSFDSALRATPGSGLKLWLGLDPEIQFQGIFPPVPMWARPSPLHLIYKDLQGKGRQLSRESTLFQGLDFDAY